MNMVKYPGCAQNAPLSSRHIGKSGEILTEKEVVHYSKFLCCLAAKLQIAIVGKGTVSCLLPMFLFRSIFFILTQKSPKTEENI